MTTLTTSLLEQLIDCQESDIPSVSTIQMMASEIMRIRGYGDMVQAPEEELRQRCMIVLKALKKDPRLANSLKKIGEALRETVTSDLVSAVEDALSFVVGESPQMGGDDWVEIEVTLLKRCESIIHDAMGFGASHSHVVHNNSLNNIRKFISNAEGNKNTLVPIKLIEQIKNAVSEIVYGRLYPMSAREELLETLTSLIENEE